MQLISEQKSVRSLFLVMIGLTAGEWGELLIDGEWGELYVEGELGALLVEGEWGKLFI